MRAIILEIVREMRLPLTLWVCCDLLALGIIAGLLWSR